MEEREITIEGVTLLRYVDEDGNIYRMTRDGDYVIDKDMMEMFETWN